MILFGSKKNIYFLKKINSKISKTLSKGIYTLGEITTNFEKNFRNILSQILC